MFETLLEKPVNVELEKIIGLEAKSVTLWFM